MIFLSETALKMVRSNIGFGRKWFRDIKVIRKMFLYLQCLKLPTFQTFNLCLGIVGISQPLTIGRGDDLENGRVTQFFLSSHCS